MNTKEYRKYFAKDIRKDSDKIRDLDFIGCYYNENNEVLKKGFFDLYHGYKPSEIDFLRSQVEIAEDSQAIYEFLQNAVDAEATNFYIFWDNENFLVINNGKKFKENDITSILNFSQSTKSQNTQNKIGKFGIGFKLIHRLVGNDNDNEDEANGLNAIVNKYQGPILFSWNNDYIKHILNENLNEIDAHWLFKIIYTNFPCGLNEKVRNKEYQEEVLFHQEELKEMISFIKKQNINTDLLSEGSMFFLKLGTGKSNLLNSENDNIKHGIKYSLNIIQELNRNKSRLLNNIVINNVQIDSEKLHSISSDDYTVLFSHNLNQSIAYYNKESTEKISFFKFFPMGDQNNGLNFIVHSSKFHIESNRRKLHRENQNILESIALDICKKLTQLKNYDFYRFSNILADLYFSDLELANNDKLIRDHFTKHLLNYLKENIPYIRTNPNGIDTFETTIDKSQIVIIDSQLNSIPLKKKYHFYFNPKQYKAIVTEAISKLGMKNQKWNIVQALIYDDIKKWIFELDDHQFNILIQEIAEKKGNHSQNIVDIWDNTYSLKEIKKILKIFQLLNKDNISFAVIKLEKDKYQIISNFNNNYIKNKAFKEFLDEYNIEDIGYYLIPDELEANILSIIGKENSYDKQILEEFLNNNQHQEIIGFIEEFNLESKYLSTLERLELDTSINYEDNSFELKTLDFILKVGKDTDIYKEKIFINELKISQLSKSPFITFKYQSNATRITNESSWDNDTSNNKILQFIDKIGSQYKCIFDIQEEEKDSVYSEIKFKVLSNHKLNNKINTKNRLKFMILYSFEKEQNFINDFNGINIFNHQEQKDESFDRLYEVLTKDVKLNNDNQLNIFHISNFFPDEIKKDSYFIEDKSFAIDCEKLPEGLENKYIEMFSKMGLTINQELTEVRKKLLNSEAISRDEIISFTNNQLTNTLEFLSLQDKVYEFNSVDTTNIKTIYKQLESSRIPIFEIFPILKTKLSFELQRVYQYMPKEYITKESINSRNKAFQERLAKEIQQKNLIFLDILDLDNIPITWKEFVENEEEKKEEAKNNIDKEILDIDIKLSEKTKYSDRTAEIGRKGELFVKKLLVDKYGEERIKDNNAIGNIYEIDFEIYDEQLEKITHKVEVKSTVEDISKNYEEKVTFLMGKKQYKEAQEYENNTYLIFVTGIETNSPEYLCVKADNNWLKPNKQKESLDTSFLSKKKEDNLVKTFTLEEKQLSDEESIINLTKFKSEKNNEVINKLGVIIRRLNKTNSNTNEKISFINKINNPIIEFSKILQEINAKVK